MRSFIPVFGLIALLLYPVQALGQSRRSRSWQLPWHDSYANRHRDDRPLTLMQTRLNRRRPNIYGTGRSFGLTTRTDRLRDELARRNSAKRQRRDRGLLPSEPPSANRVAQMLNRRNRLRSYSELGRRRDGFIGRQDYIREADGSWRGEVSPISSPNPISLPRANAATDPPSYCSLLSDHLKEKADQYYKTGLSYFRKGQYSRARDYFRLVRQLENDRPRAFVANVIASLQGNDLQSAIMNLVHAINRAESLADLRVELSEFYVRNQDFQRVLNAVNVMAKSGSGTNKSLSLMLAYYSFLNGDMITAVAEAEAAEKQATKDARPGNGPQLTPSERSKDPFVTAAKRFRDFLVAAKDQAKAPDGGA